MSFCIFGFVIGKSNAGSRSGSSGKPIKGERSRLENMRTKNTGDVSLPSKVDSTLTRMQSMARTAGLKNSSSLNRWTDKHVHVNCNCKQREQQSTVGHFEEANRTRTLIEIERIWTNTEARPIAYEAVVDSFNQHSNPFEQYNDPLAMFAHVNSEPDLAAGAVFEDTVVPDAHQLFDDEQNWSTTPVEPLPVIFSPVIEEDDRTETEPVRAQSSTRKAS